MGSSNGRLPSRDLRPLLDTNAIEAGCGWGEVVLDIETAAIASLGLQWYPVGVGQGGLIFDEVSGTGHALKGKVDIGSTNPFEIEDGRRGQDAVAIERKRKAAVAAARGHHQQIDLRKDLSAGVSGRIRQ